MELEEMLRTDYINRIMNMAAELTEEETESVTAFIIDLRNQSERRI